jgi:hypothetical protein
MLIALALLAADPSMAPTSMPPQNPTDPVVCHKSESEVGTHMRTKPVCMKKSDWQLVEQNTQSNLRTLRDHDTFDPARPGSH